MKRLGLLTSFLLVAFAVSPLHAGKQIELICAIAPTVCFGGGGDPVMPAPPPPPEIGADPIVWPPMHEAVDDALPPYEFGGGNADPAVHAFSMIADSRTHLAHASYPVRNLGELLPYLGNKELSKNDFAHWDQRKLLGQYRTDCSGGRIGIHNAAIAGGKAIDWQYFILFRGPQLSHRVVVMVGGNDVIDRTGEYMYAQILPYVGTVVRQKTTSEIHKYTKNIVLALALSGREVIVQRHFMANPGEYSAQTFAVNLGLQDLNDYAYRDFGPEEVVLVPPKLKVVWRLRWVKIKVGPCPFCVPIPLFLPWPALEWTPWEVKWAPKIPGVSFAHLRNSFPKPYFLDNDYKHLNYKGYQLHAIDLKQALWSRCWW